MHSSQRAGRAPLLQHAAICLQSGCARKGSTPSFGVLRKACVDAGSVCAVCVGGNADNRSMRRDFHSNACIQIASHAPAVHDLSSLCLHLFRWRKCMHPNRIACFCCLWSVNPLPSSVSVLTDHGLCVFLFFHRFLCGACRLLP